MGTSGGGTLTLVPGSNTLGGGDSPGSNGVGTMAV